MFLFIKILVSILQQILIQLIRVPWLFFNPSFKAIGRIKLQTKQEIIAFIMLKNNKKR